MKVILFTVALALSACRDGQPPLPTSEQSDQLNEAAAMLNELDNEKGPEANAPDPSQS